MEGKVNGSVRQHPLVAEQLDLIPPVALAPSHQAAVLFVPQQQQLQLIQLHVDLLD